MSEVCARNSARASGAMYRVAAVALLVTAVACLTGQNKARHRQPVSLAPPAVAIPAAVAARCMLGTLRAAGPCDDSTLPFQFYDSVSSRTRPAYFRPTIAADLYSIPIRGRRDRLPDHPRHAAQRPTRASIDGLSFGDTTLQVSFSTTASTITVNLTDTVSGIVNVTYTVSGSTFSGTGALCALYNTEASCSVGHRQPTCYAHRRARRSTRWTARGARAGRSC